MPGWGSRWRAHSFPPPALCERLHRGLARRRVAVGWHAIFVTIECESPHSRHAHRHSGCLHDLAVGEHVVIVVTPLAGGSARRCALEYERGHRA